LKKAAILLFTILTGIILIPIKSEAQIDEIGFGLGGLSYSGDISRGYKILDSRPGATFFLRSNANDHLSWKFAITGGKIISSEVDDPIDAFAAQRQASFNITAVELSTSIEYHFLKFRSETSLLRWSPYFTGGIALLSISGNSDKPVPYSSFQPSVPIGFGFKYVINPKWMIGFELVARKMFFDYLDNVSEGDLLRKNYQYGNWQDNDSYYFIGFSLTYAFYRIPCPFPYQ
jgi:hypothetical protein